MSRNQTAAEFGKGIVAAVYLVAMTAHTIPASDVGSLTHATLRHEWEAHKSDESVYMSGALDARRRLAQPLKLFVDREDGAVAVFSEDLGVYGAGRTLDAAVKDFAKALLGVYDELRLSSVPLSRYLTAKLHRLQSVIA